MFRHGTAVRSVETRGSSDFGMMRLVRRDSGARVSMWTRGMERRYRMGSLRQLGSAMRPPIDDVGNDLESQSAPLAHSS